MAEKGKFIVIEGVDNCGKTTQSGMLKEYLEANGFVAIQTREPGGTEVGEEIRQVLLKNRPQIMDPVSQTLLFYAARKEFLNQVVKPNLDKGIIVITDRFEPSTYVYQGMVQKVNIGLLDVLHHQIVVTSGCQPDLTVVIDITAEESMRREQNVDNQGQVLIFEKQGLEFREKLCQGYRDFVIDQETVHEDWMGTFLINGMRNKEEIHNEIRELVDKRLKR